MAELQAVWQNTSVFKELTLMMIYKKNGKVYQYNSIYNQNKHLDKNPLIEAEWRCWPS